MPEADASPLHSGLFLDLDGTLADSLTALKNVYHSFLAAFGASGDEVEFQRLNGPPLGEIIERLRMTHKLPGTPADLLQDTRPWCRRRSKARVPLSAHMNCWRTPARAG